MGFIFWLFCVFLWQFFLISGETLKIELRLEKNQENLLKIFLKIENERQEENQGGREHRD